MGGAAEWRAMNSDIPLVLRPSEAVLRDLQRLPGDLQRSTEAATALALAEELERGRAQSSAAVAKELVALMDQLRAQARVVDAPADPLDELSQRRSARLSGAEQDQQSSS